MAGEWTGAGYTKGKKPGAGADDAGISPPQKGGGIKSKGRIADPAKSNGPHGAKKGSAGEAGGVTNGSKGAVVDDGVVLKDGGVIPGIDSTTKSPPPKATR